MEVVSEAWCLPTAQHSCLGRGHPNACVKRGKGFSVGVLGAELGLYARDWKGPQGPQGLLTSCILLRKRSMKS